MMKTQNACPVCNGSGITEIGSYKNNHELFDGLHLTKCNNCEMIFVAPMPDEELLTKYNASYFMSAHGGQPQDETTISFFKAIGRLRVAYLEKYLTKNGIKPNTVLEVGPGPGFLASIWLEKNPKTKYFVYESDSSCFDSLQKLGVTILNDDNQHLVKENTIDLVIISHVLEHVSEPKIFLKSVTKNLRNGGLLFIEVPCLDYLHKDVIEPHLLFFDKAPMQYLLNDLSFRDIQASYYGEKISDLRHVSGSKKLFRKIRTKLISLGVIAPFSGKKNGMETIDNALERAIAEPFQAHIEQQEPAWWLRALSIKK
jgi:SAM-dependent methyltransferase